MNTLKRKNVFQSWDDVTRKFEFKPLIFQNLLSTRRKHPQVLQIPFTGLKTPPPIPLSRLSSCTFFASTPVAGLLQQRREGPTVCTCQLSSSRSQLFLASVLLRKVCGLPVFHSMASYTPIQCQMIVPADYGTHVTSCSHSLHGACALLCKL